MNDPTKPTTPRIPEWILYDRYDRIRSLAQLVVAGQVTVADSGAKVMTILTGDSRW